MLSEKDTNDILDACYYIKKAINSNYSDNDKIAEIERQVAKVITICVAAKVGK